MHHHQSFTSPSSNHAYIPNALHGMMHCNNDESISDESENAFIKFKSETQKSTTATASTTPSSIGSSTSTITAATTTTTTATKKRRKIHNGYMQRSRLTKTILTFSDRIDEQMNSIDVNALPAPPPTSPTSLRQPRMSYPICSRLPSSRSRSVESHSSNDNNNCNNINFNSNEFELIDGYHQQSKQISQPSSPIKVRGHRIQLSDTLSNTTPKQRISPPGNIIISDELQQQHHHHQQRYSIQPPKSNVNPFILVDYMDIYQASDPKISLISVDKHKRPFDSSLLFHQQYQQQQQQNEGIPDKMYLYPPLNNAKENKTMDILQEQQQQQQQQQQQISSLSSSSASSSVSSGNSSPSTPLLHDTSMECIINLNQNSLNGECQQQLMQQERDIVDEDKVLGMVLSPTKNIGDVTITGKAIIVTNNDCKMECASEQTSPNHRWLSSDFQSKLNINRPKQKPSYFRSLYGSDEDNAMNSSSSTGSINVNKKQQQQEQLNLSDHNEEKLMGGYRYQQQQQQEQPVMALHDNREITPQKQASVSTPTSSLQNIERRNPSRPVRLYDPCSPLQSPPQRQIFSKRVPSEIVADRKEELHARAIEHAHQPEISRLYNEFEDLGILGKGSFGTVRKVRNRVDGCLYAVKNTNRQFRGVKDKERILKEVYVLAAICSHVDNPHIVRYFNAWIEDQRLFIQIELCETSLDRYVKTMYQAHASFKQLEKTSIEVLRQILDGLKHLHSLRLVHLDLKPENIFVKNGIFKIGDLGHAAIARISNDDSTKSEETKQKRHRERATSLLSITSMDADSPCRKAARKKQESLWLKSVGVDESERIQMNNNNNSNNQRSVHSTAMPEIEDGDSRYMARELLNEYFDHLPKADIFSLGASIYEVFLHRGLPPNGVEWDSIRSGILDDLVIKNVSRGMNELLHIMMHPYPDQRPEAETLLKTGGPGKILLSEEDAEHARNIVERNNLRKEVERLRCSNNSNNVSNHMNSSYSRQCNEFGMQQECTRKRSKSM